MGWIHDTGYRPAYHHEGYPASVLLDGGETSSSSAQVEPGVIGWWAACGCGWRGAQFYPRAEWPSRTGAAPDGVEGERTGGGVFGEWTAHLERELPELAVHDLARTLTRTETQLRDAVHAARRTGLPWWRIGAAVGTTGDLAYRRWGTSIHTVAFHSPAAVRGHDLPPRP